MQREQRRAPIRHRRDDVRHAGRAAVLGLHRIGQDVGAQPHAFSDPLHESGEASTIVDDKARPVGGYHGSVVFERIDSVLHSKD